MKDLESSDESDGGESSDGDQGDEEDDEDGGSRAALLSLTSREPATSSRASPSPPPGEQINMTDLPPAPKQVVFIYRKCRNRGTCLNYGTPLFQLIQRTF